MIANKTIRTFLTEEAKQQYIKLVENKQRTIIDAIHRIKNILKVNPQHGNPIAKRKFPKKYTKKVHNLYRAPLPNFWRLLYTIEGNEKETFIFILQICNHKEYNKLFNYRKS
jgi:hypothetical protein